MSKLKTKPAEANKPYPGYPLFPHRNGQWAKKIRGRFRYFGKVADGWKPALDLYNEQKDDLHAGREPVSFNEGLTVEELWEDFLEDFQGQVERGKKGQRSYDDHVRTGEYTVAYLGKRKLVSDLRGGDWKRLRDHWETKGFAPSTMAGHIARVRAVANWAYQDEELIEAPIRFGRNFKRPAKVEFRKHRDGNDVKLFARDEIHQLLGKAKPALRAMILLGVNVGMGNKEIGFLEFRHLDLDGGWLSCRRTKTWVSRKGKLWPETIDAIQTYLQKRKDPKDPQLSRRVFITKYGGPWAHADKAESPISSQFSKLRKACKLDNQNGFYALRHTFRTEANEQVPQDLEAIRVTMGHSSDTIDDEYIERFPIARLEAVSDFVHAWLYGAQDDGTSTDEQT